MKRIALIFGVALTLFGGVTALAVLPEEPIGVSGNPSDENNIEDWCSSASTGFKDESPETPYVIDFDLPEGKVWTLLVLKAGSDQSADPVNQQIPNPVEGTGYTRTDNKQISHIILCYGDPPTETSGPTTLPPPGGDDPGTTTLPPCVGCTPGTVQVTTTTTTTVPGQTTTTTTTVPGQTTTTTTDPGQTTTTKPAVTTTAPSKLPATL